MKLKRVLVMALASLFLFAVACDDTSEFFNGSGGETVASSESSESSEPVQSSE